jgi:ABC-type oligopeptide transport system substrate-binding subunit
MAQAQLRRLGVEVVPMYVEPRAFFSTVLPRGQFDVALFAFSFDPNAAAVATIFSCGAAFNYTGYCSRPANRELGQASRTLDPKAQALLLNTADRQLASDVPVIPLFQITPATAVRTSVKGFVPLPYHPFADAENWWLER